MVICSTVKNMIYTVRCRYNAVNFLQNPHNRHPIACQWGRGMGGGGGGGVVILIYDSLSATVVAVSHVTSWWPRPRYNGTWLYKNHRRPHGSESTPRDVQFISFLAAWLPIYASVKWVNFGSGNDLVPCVDWMLRSQYWGFSQNKSFSLKEYYFLLKVNRHVLLVESLVFQRIDCTWCMYITNNHRDDVCS